MIRVEGLNKSFRLYRQPSDRLIEILTRRPRHQVHAALRDISFDVAQGESLGIIGRNGAGKSTLLKLLTGVLLPDGGSIHIAGRVTGLLELGTGFNLELSGLQNLRNNAMLLGMTPEEIEARREEILAFSELGRFIDEPMKTYSSGMIMRLAFAIAVHAEPTLFLVDEALAVGDAHFQQKCMRRIRAFREQGGAILFVSHDLNAVKMLCDRTMLLEGGRVMEIGNPEAVVNRYNFLIARLEEHARITPEADGPSAYGSGEVLITQVSVEGAGSGTAHLSSGEEAVIQVWLESHADLEDVTVGILLRDRYGQDIFGTNSRLMGVPIGLRRGARLRVDYRLRMDIGVGKYTVTAAVHADETHVLGCYHWCDQVATFEVAGILGDRFTGVCRLRPDLQVTTL